MEETLKRRDSLSFSVAAQKQRLDQAGGSYEVEKAGFFGGLRRKPLALPAALASGNLSVMSVATATALLGEPGQSPTSPEVRSLVGELQATIGQLQSFQAGVLASNDALLAASGTLIIKCGELEKSNGDLLADMENLSVELFQEANKMVADERRAKSMVELELSRAVEEVAILRTEVGELYRTRGRVVYPLAPADLSASTFITALGQPSIIPITPQLNSSFPSAPSTVSADHRSLAVSVPPRPPSSSASEGEGTTLAASLRRWYNFGRAVEPGLSRAQSFDDGAREINETGAGLGPTEAPPPLVRTSSTTGTGPSASSVSHFSSGTTGLERSELYPSPRGRSLVSAPSAPDHRPQAFLEALPSPTLPDSSARQIFPFSSASDFPIGAAYAAYTSSPSPVRVSVLPLVGTSPPTSPLSAHALLPVTLADSLLSPPSRRPSLAWDKQDGPGSSRRRGDSSRSVSQLPVPAPVGGPTLSPIIDREGSGSKSPNATRWTDQSRNGFSSSGQVPREAGEPSKRGSWPRPGSKALLDAPRSIESSQTNQYGRSSPVLEISRGGGGGGGARTIADDHRSSREERSGVKKSFGGSLRLAAPVSSSDEPSSNRLRASKTLASRHVPPLLSLAPNTAPTTRSSQVPLPPGMTADSYSGISPSSSATTFTPPTQLPDLDLDALIKSMSEDLFGEDETGEQNKMAS